MTIEPAPRGSKTVYLERVGIWYDDRRGHIHISIPGHETFHTTVNENPDSIRGHPNLFAKLKGILIEAGRWPS